MRVHRRQNSIVRQAKRLSKKRVLVDVPSSFSTIRRFGLHRTQEAESREHTIERTGGAVCPRPALAQAESIYPRNGLCVRAEERGMNIDEWWVARKLRPEEKKGERTGMARQ